MLFKALYSRILPAREDRVKILLNTYFGNIADIYETVKLFEFSPTPSLPHTRRTACCR